eukprot:TRINITY_DN1950_c0_g1_i1.p1 TRINITY_DN1950_c0_g1~~TRINITY_DN1950_c0_g1_i1.p1  ORF type:complete len:819 (+),score=189.80 TRINITY_DN1950_c0_g1_i1:115-2571(+)
MAPVEDATIGMDQNQLFYRNAEDQSLSQELRAAWKTLADGLFAFNQDDPELATKNGHNALSMFRRDDHADGVDDSILVITRALTSVTKRKEADKLLRERLAEVKKSGNKRSEGKALLGIAEVNADQRGSKKRDEAGVAAKAALSIFEDLEEPRLQASALLVSAHIAIKAKSPAVEKRAASAIHDATRAAEICRTVQDRRAEGACLHALASAHDIIEEHCECMFAAEAALDLYLEMNDPYAEAFELCCMAQWCQNYSRFDAASAMVEDALHILHNAEKPSTCQELRALNILTQIQQAKGEGTETTNVVEESLKRFQQTDNRTAEAAAMDMLLRGHCEKGEFDQALETAEKARSIFAKLNDEASEASVSVVISGLYLKLGRYDEVLEVARTALPKVKEKGSTKHKLDLMVAMCQAHMDREEFTDALECCNDMGAHFAAIGNVEGEAEALVASGSLYVAQGDLESGKVAASKAQVILSEEGNAVGEGRALRLLAEIYSKTGQHKAAIRAGERSRALLKGEESANDEAAMLFLVAQEAVQLAVVEGARVGKDKAPKKQAREALDKADRYGKTAIKLCRENPDETGIMDTLGSALCTMSQVAMLRGDSADAVGHAKEALGVFEKTNHIRNQGSAHLLLADAYRAQEKWKESQNSALSALRQFKACNPPDENGEESAQSILSAIKKHLAPAPQPVQRAQFQGSGLSPLQLQMMGGQDVEEEGVADGGGAVRTYQSSGPALDVANLSQELVLKKVLEVALALTGGDAADLEADTPLMEAGITSSAAVGLRDEIMKEIPGARLPVTLIFDYPSPAAVSEMIMESLG